MSQKEENFIKFFKFLWEKHPECFVKNPWTDKLEGEEWAFAVLLRNIIWNDPKSEKLYEEIGGYKNTLNRFHEKTQSNFEEWFRKQQKPIQIGGKDQRGAHRKACHKDDNPHALWRYLNLTKEGQITFFTGKSFDELYRSVKSIPSIGELLTFDILGRWTQTRHDYLKVYPTKPYWTGGGPKRGLKAIYGEDTSKSELLYNWEKLGGKIKAVTEISCKDIWYELENILCIYWKEKIRDHSGEMLSGELDPSKFADIYAKIFCGSGRGGNSGRIC
jgi:hypothetical protein